MTLEAIGMPTGREVVDTTVSTIIAWAWLSLNVVFFGFAIAALLFYRMTREGHRESLAKLSAEGTTT